MILLSVARDHVVTFFEGSSDTALASTLPGRDVVGLLLQDAWPDPKLLDEVTSIIEEGSVSDNYVH